MSYPEEREYPHEPTENDIADVCLAIESAHTKMREALAALEPYLSNSAYRDVCSNFSNAYDDFKFNACNYYGEEYAAEISDGSPDDDFYPAAMREADDVAFQNKLASAFSEQHGLPIEQVATEIAKLAKKLKGE